MCSALLTNALPNLGLQAGTASPLASDDSAIKPAPGSEPNSETGLSADFASLLSAFLPVSLVPIVAPAPEDTAQSPVAEVSTDSIASDASALPLAGSSITLPSKSGFVTSPLQAAFALADATIPAATTETPPAPAATTNSPSPLTVTTPEVATPSALGLSQSSIPLVGPELPATSQVQGTAATSPDMTVADLQQLVDSFTQAHDKMTLKPDGTSEATITFQAPTKEAESVSTPPATTTAPSPDALLTIQTSGSGNGTGFSSSSHGNEEEGSPSALSSEQTPPLESSVINEALLAVPSSEVPALSSAEVAAHTQTTVQAAASSADTTGTVDNANGQPVQTPTHQVSDTVAAMANHGKHSVNLNLNPETLGSVRINLQYGANSGQVTARFIVERPESMAQLQAQSEQLAQTLADQGIKLERVDWVLAGQAMTSAANNRVDATTQTFGGQLAGQDQGNTSGSGHSPQQQSNPQAQQQMMDNGQGQQPSGQQGHQPRPTAVSPATAAYQTNPVPASTNGPDLSFHPDPTPGALPRGRINLQV